MEFSTGNQELGRIFTNKKVDVFKKRFSFPSLMRFLEEPDTSKVCVLYGLQRTGKTTMMAQAAHALQQMDAVCWVHCEDGDSIQDVKNIIRENPQCRYFFLDEVTRLENFTSASSILADKYAAEDGKKIVMAGTDSLGFSFALSSELFDRAEVIHTTYIPFREYRYLLGEDKSIDDYIEYGGTLTDGHIFYNEDNLFDYTNDAIALNIQHSLELFRDGGSFGPLLSFYAADELTTFIQKIVELDNRTFLARTVNRMFHSHDIGRLRSNLERDRNLDVDTTILRNKELEKEIQQALRIKDPLLNKATPQAVEEAKRYLERLDVVYVVPGTERQEVIFTQPGLRYSQVRKQMDILERSPLLNAYPPSLRKEFSRRLDETVKGTMLEDILFVQLARDSDICEDYSVTKYRDSAGKHEFDLVLVDEKHDKAILLEVKHSTACDPEHQARHLLSDSACQSLENSLHVSIAGKAVIYCGENTHSCVNGIDYINACSMLCNPWGSIQDIRALYADFQSKKVKSFIVDAI